MKKNLLFLALLFIAGSGVASMAHAGAIMCAPPDQNLQCGYVGPDSYYYASSQCTLGGNSAYGAQYESCSSDGTSNTSGWTTSNAQQGSIPTSYITDGAYDYLGGFTSGMAANISLSGTNGANVTIGSFSAATPFASCGRSQSTNVTGAVDPGSTISLQAYHSCSNDSGYSPQWASGAVSLNIPGMTDCYTAAHLQASNQSGGTQYQNVTDYLPTAPGVCTPAHPPKTCTINVTSVDTNGVAVSGAWCVSGPNGTQCDNGTSKSYSSQPAGNASDNYIVSGGSAPTGYSLNGVSPSSQTCSSGNENLTFTVTWKKNAPAPLACNGPASVTANNQATFAATGGSGSYTWTLPSGFGSCPSGSSCSATPSTAGNYTVQVTDPNNPNLAPGTCSIKVNAAPTGNGSCSISATDCSAAKGVPCTGYVTWQGQNVSADQVFVSILDPNTNQTTQGPNFMSLQPSCSGTNCPATWMIPGNNYEFDFYDCSGKGASTNCDPSGQHPPATAPLCSATAQATCTGNTCTPTQTPPGNGGGNNGGGGNGGNGGTTTPPSGGPQPGYGWYCKTSATNAGSDVCIQNGQTDGPYWTAAQCGPDPGTECAPTSASYSWSCNGATVACEQHVGNGTTNFVGDSFCSSSKPDSSFCQEVPSYPPTLACAGTSAYCSDPNSGGQLPLEGCSPIITDPPYGGFTAIPGQHAWSQTDAYGDPIYGTDPYTGNIIWNDPDNFDNSCIGYAYDYCYSENPWSPPADVQAAADLIGGCDVHNSVTLTATPSSPTISDLVTLTATISGEGGSGGTGYSLWWNCPYSGTDIASARAMCGWPNGADPSDPNSIGFAAYSPDTTLKVPYYGRLFPAGTYHAKVIIQRESGDPAQATTTFTVNGATNSVTFSASPNPANTTSPVTLTATLGGTAQGTANYAFWWNCPYAGTDLPTALVACGSPMTIAANNTTSPFAFLNLMKNFLTTAFASTGDPAIGYQYNNSSLTVVSPPAHLFSTAGNYLPKVIVQRGTGAPTQGSLSLSVTTPPQPTCSFSASPTNITPPSSAKLSWLCTNTTSCSINNGIGPVSANSGNVSVSPTTATSYTLTCGGSGGSFNTSTTITISGGKIIEINPGSTPSGSSTNQNH